VTAIFTGRVYRYRRKGGAHLLLWGMGLTFYGLGTLTEVVLAFKFNPLALRLWYLSGAMLTAAWLGQGSVNLLVRRGRIAQALNILLGLVSLAALGLVFAAPLTSAAAGYNINLPASVQYKEILIRSGDHLIDSVAQHLRYAGSGGRGALFRLHLLAQESAAEPGGGQYLNATGVMPASAHFCTGWAGWTGCTSVNSSASS
jgi:hypothetical protein